MADRTPPHQLQAHPQRHPQHLDGGIKTLLPQNGPSKAQVLAVFTLLPVGGTLLGLAGLTFFGTLLGLFITGPLLLLFSPVLVPATVVVGLAVTGFLTSGAFGLTGLSSLTWVLNCFRQSTGPIPEQLDQAKKRMQDIIVHPGQKTKEMGQTIQNNSQEAGK